MKKLLLILATVLLVLVGHTALFAEGLFGLNLGYSQFSNQLYTLEKISNNTITNSNSIILNNLGPSIDFTGYFKIGPVYFGILAGLDIGFGTVTTNGVSTNLMVINPKAGGSLGLLLEIPYIPINLMAGASVYYSFGYSRLFVQLDTGLDIIFSRTFGLRFLFKMPYDLGLKEADATSRIFERNVLNQGFTGFSVDMTLLFFNQ